MAIKVDATTRSAVVTCTLCPSYAEGALDRAAALRLGASHEKRAHPELGGSDARELASRIATRRAG